MPVPPAIMAMDLHDFLAASPSPGLRGELAASGVRDETLRSLEVDGGADFDGVQLLRQRAVVVNLHQKIHETLIGVAKMACTDEMPSMVIVTCWPTGSPSMCSGDGSSKRTRTLFAVTCSFSMSFNLIVSPGLSATACLLGTPRRDALFGASSVFIASNFDLGALHDGHVILR